MVSTFTINRRPFLAYLSNNIAPFPFYLTITEMASMLDSMRLSDYLKINEITQLDFAKLVKTKPANICRYVKRKRIPRQKLARRIVQATDGNVTFEDLYG